VLPGKTYKPEEILRILWRRKWLILVPFVLGVVGSIAYASRVPLQYRSETLIMVVPQRISDTYVKPADTTRMEDRLRSINEQIQTRSRLEHIIEDLDLYREERGRFLMEDIVRRMRAAINVTPEGRAQESFRVSFTHPDPQSAQRVTERLASLYIEENVRDRQDFAADTNEFLDGELEEARQRLLDHEKKLEQYRRRHSGQLPSQLDSNLRAMQSAQMQLQAVSDTMNRARERRLLTERQLADARILPPALVTQEAGGSAGAAAPRTAAQQLEVAQAELEALRLRYTPDHPDIRALERSIRELRVKAVAEAGSREQGPDTQALPTAEVLRQKRIKDLEAELEVIDRQIATAEADQARLKHDLVQYQAKVDAVPSRESELVELTRDYGTLQTAYTNLLVKRQDSNLAANLETRQIGTQFRVLESASLPGRPIQARIREMIVLGGSLGGLALGLLVVGFLEYRDTTFKTDDDVTRVLSLPVLAMIPQLISAVDQEATRRPARRRTAVISAVLTVGAATAVIFWRLQS
jgi:polysaccharide chain length determinant protein (PEP-CTERM system associated)